MSEQLKKAVPLAATQKIAKTAVEVMAGQREKRCVRVRHHAGL